MKWVHNWFKYFTVIWGKTFHMGPVPVNMNMDDLYHGREITFIKLVHDKKLEGGGRHI